MPPTPSAPATATDPVSAAVDELGDIERKLAPWRLAIKREDELRKLLREACDKDPAAAPVQLIGTRFLAQLGPKASTSIIDYKKLVKAIGATKFAKFAKTTLDAIALHAPGVDCVHKEPIGARSIKIFEREPVK